MKSPHNQRPDDEAREATEEFIAKYARNAEHAAKPAAEGRARSRRGQGRDGRAVAAAHVGGHYAFGAGARALRDRPGHAVRLGGRQRGQRLRRARLRASSRAAGTASLVVAPSHSPTLVRDVAPRGPRRRRCSTRRTAACACSASARCCRSARPRRRAPSLPVDVARTIEELLDERRLDFVHVHEPFAPSVPARALRHSRALNVGSFHAPTERLLSTQVARRFVELFFGRLDARTAASADHARADAALLPGAVRARAPGHGRRRRRTRARRAAARSPSSPTRSAAALAAVPARAAPAAARPRRGGRRVIAAESAHAAAAAPRPARARALPRRGDQSDVLAHADVVVFASDRRRTPRPALLLRAVGAGSGSGRGPRCRSTRSCSSDGERGLLFEPGDVEIARAPSSPACSSDARPARALRARRGARPRPWDAVADEIEALYARVWPPAATTGAANGALRQRGSSAGR